MLPVITYDTAVIGAGPAGMFAALQAAVQGPVVLIEKNSEPGKKLLVSGSGRCNVTHSGQISEFLRHYGEHGRFLKTALHSFSNTDLIDFFSARGIAFVTEPNGKIFPASGRASDIRDILMLEVLESGITFKNCCDITRAEKKDQRFILYSTKHTFQAKRIVIACGGASYPGTGSDGSGTRLASQFGHTIIPLKPALAPIISKNWPLSECAGTSFQSLKMIFKREGKAIHHIMGEALITHHGLSGPAILDSSRYLAAGDGVSISFYSSSADVFKEMLREQRAKHPKARIKTLLEKCAETRQLSQTLIKYAGVDPETGISELTRSQSAALVAAFCAFEAPVSALGNFQIAMATSGGVSLSEVHPKTMESKRVKGLFFAGEVLDIDGDTGGYNIQAACSTGYLAGSSCAEEE